MTRSIAAGWLVFAFLGFFAGAAGAQETVPPDDPGARLFAEVVPAQGTITYEGVGVVRFYRDHEATSPTRFRIYHLSDGRIRREYVDPKTKKVVTIVGSGARETERRPDGLRVGGPDDTFSNVDLILKNYRVLVEGEEPVAGRQAVKLRLHCRYGNRPPIRIWVDTANLLILQEVRYDLSGRPVVERYLDEVRFPERLDEQLFTQPEGAKTPEAEGEHHRAARSPDELLAEAKRKLGAVWLPTHVPAGFQLSSVRSYTGGREGGRYVFHLGYTDGLTVISMFVQDAKMPAESVPRRSEPERAQPQQPGASEQKPAKTEEQKPNSPDRQPAALPVQLTYRGVEITDLSRGSRTVLRREENGVQVTIIGEVDRTDLLDTLVNVEPTSKPRIEDPAAKQE